MRMLELFSGTEVLSETFRRAGHDAVSVEVDERFNPTIRTNILNIDWNQFADDNGRFDVLWASPPCTTYSVVAIGRHRHKNKETGECEAFSEEARIGDALLLQTLKAIEVLRPKLWFIENPRAGMRTMKCMRELPKYTVTYCQYGMPFMKPTDIWTNHPTPSFRPPCHYGDPCHVAAPRGSGLGLKALPRGKERSRLPQQLCDEVLRMCEEVIG